MKKEQKQAEVLGVKITGKQMSQVLEKIDSGFEKGKKFYITTPNPEIIVQAQKDAKLKDAINKSDISIVDGMGLFLALKAKGFNGYKIIKGRELFIQLLEIANERGLKVYLLGSTSRVIKLCIDKILKIYPNVNIQGSSGPKLNINATPVTDVDTKSYKDTLRDINLFKPDFLFVAFGAPKQEKWIFDNFDSIKAKATMAVGGSLDYFSGQALIPPSWVSNFGFEWAWRLYKEPKRIGRVISAFVIFPYLVLTKRN